ncbi:RNA-binding protein with serine-rich domain 1-B-like [Octopus sinensis]|uniref:RNA-binding protein with serine-rich domain 1-B-like n=1 Tax=Octopus sinensis TaxID=2607531 RepID=A0A6P7TSW2_9MOLL|nr:RNA-binding protein with serine-rich domain 1-B-like [Octopus sinensis]
MTQNNKEGSEKSCTSGTRSHSSSSFTGSSSRSSSPEAAAAIESVRAARTSPQKKRQSPLQEHAQSPPMRPLKIFITGLSMNVNKDHIYEIFGVYGSILNVNIPSDITHPQFSKGHAYVTFEDPDSAEDAVKHFNDGQIDGKMISVSLSVTSRQNNSRYSPVRARRPRSPVRRYRSPVKKRSPRRRRSPRYIRSRGGRSSRSSSL